MKKIYITETQLNNYINVPDKLFNNLIYVGIFLDEESKNILKENVENYVYEILGNDVTFICHHMTISHISKINDDIKNWCVLNNNKEFTLTIDAIGYSDKACAARVVTDIVPTTQNYPHITIAVNNSNNGKPVDSNFIKNFIKLPKTITLTGKVSFFYKR